LGTRQGSEEGIGKIWAKAKGGSDRLGAITEKTLRKSAYMRGDGLRTEGMERLRKSVAQGLKPAEANMSKEGLEEIKKEVENAIEAMVQAEMARMFMKEIRYQEENMLSEARAKLGARDSPPVKCLRRAKNEGNEEAGKLIAEAKNLKLFTMAASKSSDKTSDSIKCLEKRCEELSARIEESAGKNRSMWASVRKMFVSQPQDSPRSASEADTDKEEAGSRYSGTHMNLSISTAKQARKVLEAAWATAKGDRKKLGKFVKKALKKADEMERRGAVKKVIRGALKDVSELGDKDSAKPREMEIAETELETAGKLAREGRGSCRRWLRAS
jgi:hypothetical protein